MFIRFSMNFGSLYEFQRIIKRKRSLEKDLPSAGPKLARGHGPPWTGSPWCRPSLKAIMAHQGGPPDGQNGLGGLGDRRGACPAWSPCSRVARWRNKVRGVDTHEAQCTRWTRWWEQNLSVAAGRRQGVGPLRWWRHAADF
jgi:hypothetical protein